jgi:uncharacterized protein YjdB
MGWSGWIVLAQFLAACSGPASSDGPSGRIVVDPATISIAVRATAALSAHAFNADGAETSVQDVFWSTENAAIATVSSSGVVRGVGPGTVKVAASQAGQSGIAQVTVVPPGVALVRLQPSDGSVFVGKTMPLQAIAITASGEEVTGRTATWSSSSSSTATVNSSGVVTGVAPGAVTIRATVDGVEGTASISVLQVPIATIALSPAPATVEERKTIQITATARDASGATVTGRTIVWSSSNDAVVGVSQTGLVTGITPGTATITASAPGAAAEGTSPSGTLAVTVQYAPVASVLVIPSVTSVALGATTTFSATLLDAAGLQLTAGGRTLSWESLDPARATINAATGVATGVSPGSTRIRASASSPGQGTLPIGEATLTVTQVPVSSVTVVPSIETIHLGPTYSRTFTAVASDAAGNVISGRNVVWTSSNQNVAAVVATTGLVTGLGLGTASITATVDGVSGTAAVSVDLVPIVSVTLSPTSSNLVVPGTLQLGVTLRDSAGAPINGVAFGNRAILWASTNNAVATVSGVGIVTALAPGSVTISARTSTAVGTAIVTVLGIVNSVALAVSPDSVILPGSTSGSVTVRDAASNALPGKSVILTSSKPSVATVTPTTATTNVSGQVSFTVTSVAAGTTTITATSDGKSAAQGVRVVQPIATASTITLAVSPDSVVLPGSTGGSVTVRGSGSQVLAGRTVSLTSSAPLVATISPATAITNAAGQVTFSVAGVTVGTTTITATSDGKSAGQGVRVVLPSVNSVVVSPSSTSVKTGAMTSLTATARDVLNAPLSGRACTISSSDATKATASPASATTNLLGQVSVTVTGVKKGTVTVTVSCGGKSGSSSVTVND